MNFFRPSTATVGNSSNRIRGFTLIEVLLAVAVFSVVLAAINAVFFAALRLRNKTTEAFATVLPLQQTVNFMKRDLTGLMVPGGTMGGSLQTSAVQASDGQDNTGQRVSPDFYTTTAITDDTSPWAEVQKVAYFLQPSADQGPGKDLVRAVKHNLLPANTEQPVQQRLMGGVQGVAFQFYNGTSWAETWDSTVSSNLPTAIKVQIALVPEDNRRAVVAPVEFVVPVIVQARTNQAAQASGGGR